MTDTDILERLREEVEYTPIVGSARYRLVSLLSAVEREIERLRARVEEFLHDNELLISEMLFLREEVARWKDRYEAERADHEATMKHADKER